MMGLMSGKTLLAENNFEKRDTGVIFCCFITKLITKSLNNLLCQTLNA